MSTQIHDQEMINYLSFNLPGSKKVLAEIRNNYPEDWNEIIAIMLDNSLTGEAIWVAYKHICKFKVRVLVENILSNITNLVMEVQNFFEAQDLS